MAEKQFTVIDKTGIHARPATQLVSTANQFKSDIFILHKGKEVNFKSVLGVMSLGLGMGEELSFVRMEKTPKKHWKNWRIRYKKRDWQNNEDITRNCGIERDFHGKSLPFD